MKRGVQELFTHSLIIFFSLMSQLVSEVKLREEEGQITRQSQSELKL